MNKRTIGLVLGSALLLTGCGGNSGDGSENAGGDGEALVIDGEQIASAELLSAAQEEGELVLYDNYPAEQWRAILDVFEEDTGVEVEHIRLVTPQLYERVVSEAGADQLAADAIGIGDITLINDMVERGILASYESPVAIEALQPSQYDENHHWYTAANLVMALSYNEALLEGEDAPEGWNDLLDPSMKGKIGVTPIGTGGSAFSVYHFLRDTYGIEYWEELAANNPRTYESVVPLTADLVRGEVPVGITSLGVVAGHRADGAPVVPIFPEDGTPAFSNMVAVTETAEHPNAAKLYVDWLLSLRGQSTLVEITSEFPARPDAPSPEIEGVEVPSADSGMIVVPDFSAWLELREPWTEEWNDIFN